MAVHQTNNGLRFVVTEEIWRDCGNGKMVCLSTGETMEKSAWKNLCSKETFLNVTLPS